MRKRRRHIKTFVRPKESEYKESLCLYALGTSHNLDATNNNPLGVCFSSPQVHCTTRSIVSSRVKACFPINSMVIGKDGGNGDRQTFGIGEDGEPCPTLQTSHNHACAIVKQKQTVSKVTSREREKLKTLKEGCYCGQYGITIRFGNDYWFEHAGTLGTAGGDNLQTVVQIKKAKAFGIDQQGGKGGANFTEDVAPTICSDSHGTPHGVCLLKPKVSIFNETSKGGWKQDNCYATLRVGMGGGHE